MLAAQPRAIAVLDPRIGAANGEPRTMFRALDGINGWVGNELFVHYVLRVPVLRRKDSLWPGCLRDLSHLSVGR